MPIDGKKSSGLFGKMLQNKMINPTTNLFRPINILMYGWVVGKHICVDLHVVFLTCGIEV